MGNPLSAVKELLKELSTEEKSEILNLLGTESLIIEVLGLSECCPEKCRCCGSKNFIKNGKETQSGRQRYLCKICGKTFTSMTGTALDRMHKKEDFIRYVSSLINNLTLREAASVHNIVLSTSFHWRHKLLGALGFSTQEVELRSVIQSDEVYIPFSLKGQADEVVQEQRKPRKRGTDRKTRGISNEQVCVITAMDESDTIFFHVAKRGRVDSDSIDKALAPRISDKPIRRDMLVSDSETAYNSIVKKKKLIHMVIPTGKHLAPNGANIQKVNSLHSRLDKWMRQFNGVASKYLQNYMNYFTTIENLKNIRGKFIKVWEWILSNKQAFTSYLISYQQFQRT